jgi:hypothetical protein
MAEEKNLKVDELNFQAIKTNFRNYLRSQDQFRDYNFEASGLSALLDLLAYNTYYNSFYLNMIATESFLTTAQKRNSVVALAKSLNYTPRSKSAAIISGTVTVTTVGNPVSVAIPKYTRFTGTVDGTTYNFLSTEAVTVFQTSPSTYVGEITLKEGTLITRRYVVNSADLEQRFIIPNLDVDTTTLTVRVLNSTTDTTTRVFIKAETVVDIDENSQVYFLDEIEDGQYEVKFGDDVFGVKPTNGNLIVLEYIVTNGADANDILNLTYTDSISGVSDMTFVAIAPAAGGTERESLESIRFNAPKYYESQNRVVTAQDYASLLLRQPNIESVLVWGGEDNSPPAYGKVFIAVKPIVGNALTPTEKENLIETVIKDQKILTVSTEIVDPEFIFILVDCEVKYDSKLTILSESELRSLIVNAILAYNQSDINTFSKYFRFSKFSRAIDFAEKSILSNVLSVRMKRDVPIALGQSVRYEINFSNQINDLTLGRFAQHPFGVGNQISSNAFTISGFSNCFLDDNDGIVRVYRSTTSGNIGVIPNAGTINYVTGQIVLTNFSPTAFADGTNVLKVTAVPKNKDILPLRNQILSIREENINLSLIDDNTISLVRR